jgi:hypothetical protein
MPNIHMNLKSYSASYFFRTNQCYLETKANERVQVSEPQPADRGVCLSLSESTASCNSHNGGPGHKPG